MKLYQCQADDTDNPVTFGTRSEAQSHGKDNATPTFRGSVRIHELDYKTDKAGVIDILNGVARPTIIRSWKLSARGGLVELK